MSRGRLRLQRALEAARRILGDLGERCRGGGDGCAVNGRYEGGARPIEARNAERAKSASAGCSRSAVRN